MIGFFVAAYVFAIGASIGSFLNVCIGRWPDGLSVIKPRSRCPKCGHKISAIENVPIFSWIFLRGKCRGCGDTISIQYPAVELLIGVVWLVAYLAFGPSLTALRVAVFTTVMAGISITDAKHFLIPDGFTVFGLIWQLVTMLIAIYVGDSGPFAQPWDAVIGMCVGAGAIAIVGWLGEVALKRPAMGFGDVTLMAVVGAAVGPERALLTIFVASVIAPIVLLLIVYPLSARGMATDRGQTELPLDAAPSWRRRELPFGVFLAPAAIVALLWGDAIIGWYVSVSGL